MTLQILIIGQTNRAEAVSLWNWILDAWKSADVRQDVSLRRALDTLAADSWIPDLVVILQSWSDEQNRQEVDRLSRFAPLARWVVCYGSWCEADGRTRDYWPLAVRVPMRSATARLQHEWQLLNGIAVSSTPMSASREEYFAIDHPGLQAASTAATVVVNSPDGEYRRYLTEVLAAVGHHVAGDDVSGLEEKARVVLFDIDPWDVRRRLELMQCHPGDVILGLMNLPSPETVAELMDLGVKDVLPKLGDQQRIVDVIERVSR